MPDDPPPDRLPDPTLAPAVPDPALQAWNAQPFLEKVTQIAPVIIYVFNQKTQSNEYSNRSIGSFIGYTGDEIVEMGADLFPTLCHPDDFPRILTYFNQLQNLPDATPLQIQYRLRHKNGGWVWLSSRDAVFERDSDGSVLRHIGTASDITPLKNTEQEALHQRHVAEMANEELRSFAYSVSHDMKSPSNTLSLLLDELLDEHGHTLNRDAHGLVDLCRTTVENMQNLIEEVLNYTRIIGQDFPSTTVNLGQTFDLVCGDLHGPITEANARVTIGPMPIIFGNEALLRTMFQNLLSNAVKFHSPGTPPEITIMDVSDPNDSEVEIAVTDNGIGLPPGTEETIFGLFKRLHLDDAYPGTGLGLSLCQRIAINHGGGIRVRSTEGKGATFTVTLKRS